MSIHACVVTYRELSRAVRGDLGLLARSIDEGAEAITPRDRVQKAEMLGQLSHALTVLEAEERRSGVLVAPRDPVASLLQTYLAREAARKGNLEPLSSGGLEAKFDSHDIAGWMGSFFTWWKKIRPHGLVPAAPNPEPFADKARLAILGDWGTGLYGAPVCANSIARDPKPYQMVFHLGDVYYSGDDDEIRERFLQFWPKIDGVIGRALNANHEMYTGGKAYFGLALPRLKQKASYWALQNDSWTLVGLDSAYADHDLAGSQPTWLRKILVKSGDRKTILFTHHQPYSLFETQGPKLIAKLAPLLDANEIFAWYWGHEHRCVLYEKHPVWGLHGRCVGHSGFPYFRDDFGSRTNNLAWNRVEGRNLVPAGEVLDGPNPYIAGHESDYGPNGYLTLEFDGPHLHEIVHDADGTPLRDTTLA